MSIYELTLGPAYSRNSFSISVAAWMLLVGIVLTAPMLILGAIAHTLNVDLAGASDSLPSSPAFWAVLLIAPPVIESLVLAFVLDRVPSQHRKWGSVAIALIAGLLHVPLRAPGSVLTAIPLFAMIWIYFLARDRMGQLAALWCITLVHGAYNACLFGLVAVLAQ